MTLVIVGDGEFAQIAYEYFTHDSQEIVVGFAVEKKYRAKESLYDLPVINLEDLETSFPPDKVKVFVAVTFTQLNRVRARLYTSLKTKGYRFASYISSKAFVWHNVEIGENVFIFENNTLQPFVKLGNNVILWSGNHIGHRSTIEDHCFLSSHVVISGYCSVGRYSFMGVNSTVADKVTIAQDNFIALASVINKNTEADRIYRGNPAKASKITAKRYFKAKE